ncbi:hypothetical protein JOM56_013839 [Amanita muscaria]
MSRCPARGCYSQIGCGRVQASVKSNDPMGHSTADQEDHPEKVVVHQDGMGRTSNPYADGRTPAWDASSHTPNPSAGGGKTLAWKKNTQPDGGTMPAWNALSDSETPEFICVWRCSSWTVMGDTTAARSNSNAGNPGSLVMNNNDAVIPVQCIATDNL